eukprot:4145570-Amphidinium_carterae.1
MKPFTHDGPCRTLFGQNGASVLVVEHVRLVLDVGKKLRGGSDALLMSGTIYFYHTLRDESSWEHPAAAIFLESPCTSLAAYQLHLVDLLVDVYSRVRCWARERCSRPQYVLVPG